MNDDFWIPRTLDDPKLFLAWEVDSIFVPLSPMYFFILIDMKLLGLIFALIIGKVYGTIKSEGGRNFLVKFLYWNTPSELWLSKNHPSYKREYLGE